MNDEGIAVYLESLTPEDLEIWRILIVQMKEKKIKQNEADLIALSSSSLRLSNKVVSPRPIDIAQWKGMPSPKRGTIRVKSVPSIEMNVTTSDSVELNDIGSDNCSGVFIHCSVGSVWFIRLSGLYRPDELANKSAQERSLILQSSVCGEVVQRNEGNVVLKILEMPVRVQITSNKAIYCIKKTMFDMSVVHEHFSKHTLAALRSSLKLSDFDRYQLLLAILRDSNCYVSEIKWNGMNRNPSVDVDVSVSNVPSSVKSVQSDCESEGVAKEVLGTTDISNLQGNSNSFRCCRPKL